MIVQSAHGSGPAGRGLVEDGLKPVRIAGSAEIDQGDYLLVVLGHPIRIDPAANPVPLSDRGT